MIYCRYTIITWVPVARSRRKCPLSMWELVGQFSWSPPLHIIMHYAYPCFKKGNISSTTDGHKLIVQTAFNEITMSELRRWVYIEAYLSINDDLIAITVKNFIPTHGLDSIY